MSFNTLDEYGSPGVSCFIEEADIPEVTDSKYHRHIAGGDNIGKKTSTNIQQTDGLISDCTD